MTERRATVFGASGFVGRHLVVHLRARGLKVRAVPRGAEGDLDGDLGLAFYCIGLTADFRSRPFDTIDAHVSKLTDILRRYRFTSFVYASSTRVYARAASTDEADTIPVSPATADDLYNISKLMGEAVCLGCGKPGVKIARLSNVFGAEMSKVTFLASVIEEAVRTGTLELRTALQSDKDYVAVEDVVAALHALATQPSDAIVNVARGQSTTHGDIVEALRGLIDLQTTVAANAPRVTFPPIRTARLDALVPGPRTDVIACLPGLVAAARQR